MSQNSKSLDDEAPCDGVSSLKVPDSHEPPTPFSHSLPISPLVKLEFGLVRPRRGQTSLHNKSNAGPLTVPSACETYEYFSDDQVSVVSSETLGSGLVTCDESND